MPEKHRHKANLTVKPSIIEQKFTVIIEHYRCKT